MSCFTGQESGTGAAAAAAVIVLFFRAKCPEFLFDPQTHSRTLQETDNKTQAEFLIMTD
jgi:hypothetical protein